MEVTVFRCFFLIMPIQREYQPMAWNSVLYDEEFEFFVQKFLLNQNGKKFCDAAVY